MDDSYKNETITKADKNLTVVYNVLLADLISFKVLLSILIFRIVS